MTEQTKSAAVRSGIRIQVPMAMLAELTHRCPLSCPYCSNPLELVRRSGELSTEEWIGVFRQAAALGVLHLHLSGGEPAARRDLDELVTAAKEADLYSNLIWACRLPSTPSCTGRTSTISKR